MTLLTSHRRISSRTKRKYRAIKDFIHKALGNNSSQPKINISSSIAVNVSDLKHKIVGIERQLDAVNKNCYIDHENSVEITSRTNNNEHDVKLDKQSSQYNLIDEQYRNKKNSDSKRSSLDKVDNTASNVCSYKKNGGYDLQLQNPTMHTLSYEHLNAMKNIKKGKHDHTSRHHLNLNKHKTTSIYEGYKLNSSRSNHSIITHYNTEFSSYESDEQHHNYFQSTTIKPTKMKKYKQGLKKQKFRVTKYDEQSNFKQQKKICQQPGVDKDFIEDIINRQYKPVNFFGRKESAISQFSAPVCRDFEFSCKDSLKEGTDLCSCCHGGYNCLGRYSYHENHLNKLRSICDTRLYSNKRQIHAKSLYHYPTIDVYNDSELYDIVPVKEKSSPKSRKKFLEDNMIIHDYREVPPSPRTHRPQLNLKSQYVTEIDATKYNILQSKYCKIDKRRQHQPFEKGQESDENHLSSEVFIQSRDYEVPKHIYTSTQKDAQVKQDIDTMTSLHYSNEENYETLTLPKESGMNKQDDRKLITDKPDSALSEIRDLLQNLFQEIKKETSLQCDKSDNTVQSSHKRVEEIQGPKNIVNTSTAESSNNYGGDHCFMPNTSLQNPWQYPIFPVYSFQHQHPTINLQQPYLPATAVMCQSCATNPQGIFCNDKMCSKFTTAESNINEKIKNENETDAMIKEIYKFVAQSPECNKCIFKNNSPRSNMLLDKKKYESRSVGENSKPSRQDAMVGTPRLKLYSKSCEAITSETEYVEKQRPLKASYSDSLLGRTITDSSDSEFTSEARKRKKPKESKFSKVLKSFGFCKKKNKDIAEELSECDSLSIEEEPSFKQNVTNYVIHGQECLHPPNVPFSAHYYHPHQNFNEGFSCPPYHKRGYEHSSHINPNFNVHDRHYQHNRRKHPRDPRNHHYHHNVSHSSYPEHPYLKYPQPQYPHSFPPVPPYPTSLDLYYNHITPQIPLCLKEIEVKSIATQSDKKVSFFQKFSRKTQPRDQSLTQSDGFHNIATHSTPAKQNFWKNIQAKSSPGNNLDAMNFSFKTQNELAAGDQNIRSAVLKKMFYKRNPFSPHNLIIKTLLGKDPSSFGNPPKQIRPRMFI